MAEQPAKKPGWLAGAWNKVREAGDRIVNAAENRDPRMPELPQKRVDNVLGGGNPRQPDPFPNARVPLEGNRRVGDNGGNVFDAVQVRNRQARQRAAMAAGLQPRQPMFRPVDEKPPVNDEIVGGHRRNEADMAQNNGMPLPAQARKALEGRDALLSEVGGKNQKTFNADMVRAVNKWAQSVFEGGAKSQAEYNTARELNGVWRSYLATKEALSDPKIDPKRKAELEVSLKMRHRELQAYIEFAAHGYIMKPGAGRINNGRLELQNNGQWAAPEALDQGVDANQQALYADEQKFQPGAPVQAPMRNADAVEAQIADNQRRIADKIKNDPGNMPEDEPLPPRAPEKLVPPAPPQAAAAPAQRQVPPPGQSRGKLGFSRDGKPLRYQQPAAPGGFPDAKNKPPEKMIFQPGVTPPTEMKPFVDPAVAAAHRAWAERNRQIQQATPHPLGFPDESKGLPSIRTPLQRPSEMPGLNRPQAMPRPGARPESAYEAARGRFGNRPQPAPRPVDMQEEYDIARQEAALRIDVANAERERAAAKRKQPPKPLFPAPSLPGQKPAPAPRDPGMSAKEFGNRAAADAFTKPGVKAPQQRIPDGKLAPGAKPAAKPPSREEVAANDLVDKPQPKDEDFEKDLIAALTAGKLEIRNDRGVEMIVNPVTGGMVPLEDVLPHAPSLRPQKAQPIKNSRHGCAVKMAAATVPGAEGVSAGSLATMQRYLDDVAQHHPEELQKILQQHKVGERENQYAWLDKLGDSTVQYLRHLAGQKPSIGGAPGSKLPPKVQKLAAAVLTDPATYRRSLRELHHELIGAGLYQPGSRPVWPDRERMLEVSGKLKGMGRLGELDQYLQAVAHGKPMIDHEESPAPTPPPENAAQQAAAPPQAPCHGCSGGMNEQVQRLAARGLMQQY